MCEFASSRWYTISEGGKLKDYKEIFERLYNNYGPQNWWPADTKFEIAVGAILTQNTMWRNVVLSIKNLENAGLLEPYRMYITPIEKLSYLIKPSGFPKLKAMRLKNFLAFFSNFSFDFDKLEKFETRDLYGMLLTVNGIGHETASSILLYIFNRPIFVYDAYFKRIVSRLGIDSTEIEKSFNDAKVLGEFHALIVQHSKMHCRSKPICRMCPLIDICEYGEQNV